MTVKSRHATKYDELIAGLALAESADEVVTRLRCIKNAAIGSHAKKRHFLGSALLCEQLVARLAQTNTCDVRAQTGFVVASLALALEQVDDEHVGGFASAKMLQRLCDAANESDLRLVEAALRALRSLLAVVEAGPVNESSFVMVLIKLLNPPSLALMEATSSQRVLQQTRINELVAAIIARLAAISSDAQFSIIAVGAFPRLLALLARPFTPFNKMQEQVLDALGHLVKNNADAAKKLVAQCVSSTDSSGDERSFVVLLRFLKESGQPMTKLLAAACLSNLYRTVTFENQRVPSTLLLPTLIKLFSDGPQLLKSDISLLERAPLVFADLIAENENLQKLALEADAVSRLAEILMCPEVKGCIGSPSAELVAGSNAAVAMAVDGEEEEGVKTKSLLGKSRVDSVQTSLILDTGVASSKTYERTAESCLLAIAAITSLREDTRKSAIDANLLPLIVAALRSPRTPLRSAACKCTRSLSRSVKTLRTSLVDAGVAHPLFGLLADPSESVRADACATLCNIVLDFSPMKRTVIEGGGVERIVGTLKGAHGVELRVNCVWALKNLLYQAGSDVKGKVMAELGWDGLKQLIFDPQVSIQEQSLNLLRNLVCGRVEDIEAVFEGFSEAALSILFEKKLGGDLGTRSSELDAVVLQTLYVIVNIATGNERHKGLIIGSDLLLSNIFKFMNHDKALIRLATVWCVINLSEPDEADPKYTQDRLERLLAFGFQEQLKQMLLDSDPDVKERVKIAIKNLSTVNAMGDEARRFGGGDAMEQDMSLVLGDDMGLEGMQDLSSYLAGRRG